MRSMHSVLVVALAIIYSSPVSGQSPTYGVGREPSPQEIRVWDIAIGPDGKELPEGGSTAAIGRNVYAAKCAACHGKGGKEGPYDVLVGGFQSLTSARPVKTVGSYWPYATTLWDYINRAMPFQAPGSLSSQEVYGITAYILYLNGIVQESETISAQTLARVRMPNRDGFVADPRPDTNGLGKAGRAKPAKR